ncbi:hypothetical protein C5167_029310 [Papaver somniferum]|nr:hypothetical protein C5167_029310 [Papaver somniferum]
MEELKNLYNIVWAFTDVGIRSLKWEMICEILVTGPWMSRRCDNRDSLNDVKRYEKVGDEMKMLDLMNPNGFFVEDGGIWVRRVVVVLKDIVEVIRVQYFKNSLKSSLRTLKVEIQWE